MSTSEQRPVMGPNGQTVGRPRKIRWWHRLVVVLVVSGLPVIYGIRVRMPGYYPRFLYQPVAFWDGPADSTIYRDPLKGWGLNFPSSWHRQLIWKMEAGGVYPDEVSGVFLSTNHRGVAPPALRWDRSNPLFDFERQPSTLVAVQVMHNWTGGFKGTCEPQPFPLSLTGAERSTTPAGAEGPTLVKLSLPFIGNFEFNYSVTAWIGNDVSKADLAALESIVSSISFDDVEERYNECPT